MKLKLYLQIATLDASYDIPIRKEFIEWIKYVFKITPTQIDFSKAIEITIRLVDKSESAQLNQQYRHKSGPTNILSFPVENFPNSDSYYLGDLLVCVPLVFEEATEQGKTPVAHWAHLIIHGVLHLLGYDHEIETDAAVMEKLEINILEQLGYENPY